jgi:hypothetical protein
MRSCPRTRRHCAPRQDPATLANARSCSRAISFDSAYFCRRHRLLIARSQASGFVRARQSARTRKRHRQRTHPLILPSRMASSCEKHANRNTGSGLLRRRSWQSRRLGHRYYRKRVSSSVSTPRSCTGPRAPRPALDRIGSEFSVSSFQFRVSSSKAVLCP